MTVDYVVDTSALIQAYIEDTHTAQARNLVHIPYADSLNKLHIVDFCLSECVNILWKRVAFRGLRLEDAQKNLEAILDTPLTIYPASPYFARALELASHHHLAIYDSVCLVLAQTLQFPLVTDDTRQAEIAQKVGVILKPLTDFPEYQPS